MQVPIIFDEEKFSLEKYPPHLHSKIAMEVAQAVFANWYKDQIILTKDGVDTLSVSSHEDWLFNYNAYLRRINS